MGEGELVAGRVAIDFPEQMISRIRLEIFTCQPGVCPISGCQFPFEFEKLVFVDAARNEIPNVVGTDLVERFSQHQRLCGLVFRSNQMIQPIRVKPR